MNQEQRWLRVVGDDAPARVVADAARFGDDGFKEPHLLLDQSDKLVMPFERLITRLKRSTSILIIPFIALSIPFPCTRFGPDSRKLEPSQQSASRMVVLDSGAVRLAEILFLGQIVFWFRR